MRSEFCVTSLRGEYHQHMAAGYSLRMVPGAQAARHPPGRRHHARHSEAVLWPKNPLCSSWRHQQIPREARNDEIGWARRRKGGRLQVVSVVCPASEFKTPNPRFQSKECVAEERPWFFQPLNRN